MLQHAIELLDSLYVNGDLSIDQHTGIMKGFEDLGKQLNRATEQIERQQWQANEDDERVVSTQLRLESAQELANAYYGMLVRLWNTPKLLDMLDDATLRDFDRLVLNEG